jgi:hypothetical protein
MAKLKRVFAVVFGISAALPLARAFALPSPARPDRAAGRTIQALCVNPGGTLGCQTTISAAVAKITTPVVTITVAAGHYIDKVSINTGLTPSR